MMKLIERNLARFRLAGRSKSQTMEPRLIHGYKAGRTLNRLVFGQNAARRLCTAPAPGIQAQAGDQR